MKQTILWGILVISLLTFGLTACNDDKTSSISLRDHEGNELSLYFPETESQNYELKGGEGDYSAESSDNNVVKAVINSKGALSLTAVSRGEAVVTVSDEAENELKIKVSVDYETLDLVIDQLDANCKGDLREKEKEVILAEAIKTIPVEEGGGYKFIYTNQERTEGKVNIYRKEFGKEFETSDFRIVEVIPDEKETGLTYTSFELTIDDELRTFVLAQVASTRAVMPTLSRYLLEYITEDFREEYPDVEEVYTIQGIPTVALKK